MDRQFLHILPSDIIISSLPKVFINPYTLPPPSCAQLAARDTIDYLHRYMDINPDSELHRQGKMFGVLVVEKNGEYSYLRAFSAQLDSSYIHYGFVPPIYLPKQMPYGKNKEESQRLQRLLFASYQFTNVSGEQCDLLTIFRTEKTIISPKDWFSGIKSSSSTLPPSGAGECCAPKLLQYAFLRGYRPLALAEFWVGKSPINELRREGYFYAPCSSRCVPILRHMLKGITMSAPTAIQNEILYTEIKKVYEDDCIMVVNKPSGLLSVPGKSESVSLRSYLCINGAYDYLEPVHRLDQDTSGLLVLAKRQDIYTILQAYFQRRDIMKRYEALITNPKYDIPLEGMIDLPLLPNPFDRPRQMVDKLHGKVSQTRYIVREKRNDGYWLVDFYPLTGRTHQLRIHAAHPEGLNAPIVGDRLYGKHDSRLMLHAAEISFMHPITKEEMHFCIPSSF